MNSIVVEKKLAIVTGGAGDIAADICLALWRSNHSVISIDVIRNDDLPEDIAQFELDITDTESVRNHLQNLTPSILINCAGVTRDSFLHKMADDQWDSVVDINLTGAYNVTRAVIESMRKNKYGRIVNISSVNGQRGQIGQCNYSASKAGLHGFTMALALESIYKNITVNTVSPGYVDTKMTKKIDEKILASIIKTIPAGRMATPADITRAAMFLVHEDNTYLTGANIPVNGGLFTSF